MKRQITKLMAILLVAMMIVGTLVPVTAATATITPTENWYDANATELHVTNAADLLAFAKKISEDVPDAANGNATQKFFKGKTVYIDADIDINPDFDGTLADIADVVNAWPYASQMDFNGTIDGQGHTISGIYVTGEDYVGIFGGQVDTGVTVKNLTITDSLVVGNKYVGGLFGLITKNFDQTLITDVTADINVITNMAYDSTLSDAVTNAKNRAFVGGFIGRSNYMVTISGCVFLGDVISTNGVTRIGGFVGEAPGALEAKNEDGSIKTPQSVLAIVDCAYYGNIKGALSYISPVVGVTEKNGEVRVYNIIFSGDFDKNGTANVYWANANTSLGNKYKGNIIQTWNENDTSCSYLTVDFLKSVTAEQLADMGFENWEPVQNGLPLPKKGLTPDIIDRDIVYFQDYEGTSVPTEVKVDSTGAAATVSIVDGQLVIDNTAAENTEAGVLLVDGLPKYLTGYEVKATITLLEIKNIDTEANQTKYAALGANWVNPTKYNAGWVRYNGRVNFQVRNSTYKDIGYNVTEGKTDKTDANVADDLKLQTGLNVSYELRIKFYNNTADLYINGTKIIAGENFVDNATGAIGIMVKGGVKVAVDNVSYKLTTIADPTSDDVEIDLWPDETPAQPNAYETLPLPYIDETNEEGKPYGTWKAGNNPLYALADGETPFLESRNTGSDSTPNGSYKNPNTTITIGAGFNFTKGIGMHPMDPNNPVKGSIQSYTLIDISKYTAEGSTTPADTFYAVVGFTNANALNGNSTNTWGVEFKVYGDKVGDGKNFELLAQTSDPILLRNIGEFNVDITGVKLLKLVVMVPEGATTHASSACAWADAYIFKADANAVKPDYSAPVTPPPSGDGDGEGDGTTTTDSTTTTTGTPETQAPAGENNTTTAPDTTEAGCASGIGATVAMLVTVGAAVTCIRKKKKED